MAAGARVLLCLHMWPRPPSPVYKWPSVFVCLFVWSILSVLPPRRLSVAPVLPNYRLSWQIRGNISTSKRPQDALQAATLHKWQPRQWKSCHRWRIRLCGQHLPFYTAVTICYAVSTVYLDVDGLKLRVTDSENKYNFEMLVLYLNTPIFFLFKLTTFQREHIVLLLHYSYPTVVKT